MPRGFQFITPDVRFWTPLVFTDLQKSDDSRHQNGWTNIGRLKLGATIQQAQQQVNAINAANLERFPQFKPLLINSGFYTRIDRFQDVLVKSVRGTLYLLWGGAALVLLIGTVNIANLAVARSNVRIREISTRLAIGASRGQVAWQMITESSMLTLAGGLAGILTGFGMLRALSTVGLDRLPRANEIQMDVTVIAAALALAGFAGFLVGLVPVVHLFRVNLTMVLHEESRTGTQGRTHQALRRGLVVVQVAFAFVLLIGSGLLVASFRNLLASDPGFKSKDVITAGIWMSDSRYHDDPAMRQFTDRLLEAVRKIPGVVFAGGTTNLPLSGNHDDGVIMAEGYQMAPGESLTDPMMTAVTPGYFEAMGTPLLRGRFFDKRDNEKATPAIIVDERDARKFWPYADPIGKRMFVPERDLAAKAEDRKWYTVVGVVREVRLDDLARIMTFGAVYFPASQEVQRGLSLAIKTSGDFDAALRNLRSTVKELDPQMLLSFVQPMDEYVARSLMQRRTAMLLATSFGVVALFLSCLGIYGVLAFLVTQRFREIGIRIALGSTSLGIFRLVLREGTVLVLAGLLLGLAIADALQNVLQSEVYGVAVMDPTVIGTIAIVFGFIALTACSIPARRATRVDPVTVLNQL